MSKKMLNQNTKYTHELIDAIEPDFIFSSKPIKRLKNIEEDNKNKGEKLEVLKNQINSIKNCNLKKLSNSMVFGAGNINSPVMIVGEAPGEKEETLNLPFQGDVGILLEKMLLAINIKKEKIYLTYSINFRLPEDRKPTSLEIKRYSVFLKEHISIINPEIVILMGSTAMEAVTGLTSRISSERGKWKEIILRNKTFPLMITFSPSYLLRFPENKKYSWEDLKKIRQKIKDLNISFR